MQEREPDELLVSWVIIWNKFGYEACKSICLHIKSICPYSKIEILDYVSIEDKFIH